MLQDQMNFPSAYENINKISHKNGNIKIQKESLFHKIKLTREALLGRCYLVKQN